jgi:hypothetical protein
MGGFVETLLATSAAAPGKERQSNVGSREQTQQRTDVAGYVSAKAYRGDPTLQPLSAQ